MLTQTKSSDKAPKAQAAPSRAHASISQVPALQDGIGFSTAQQFAGNFAVQRLFRGGAIRAKLSVSQPDDPYEQEADQVADQVMRIPEQQLQRVCACGGACPKCQTEQSGEERLQTKAAGSSDLRESAAPAAVHEALITPGQPLDAAARGFFEPRLGVDLANVRIHSDVQADAAARAVHARAFTLGPNVVFGQGQYQPQSDSGRRLIAHELAHVVQQSSDGGNGALSANVQRAPGDDPNAIQSYVFAGDKKLSTDRDFARRKGQEIAARIPQSGEVSWDDRLELSGMLEFFQGEAKELYIEEVQRARVDPSKEIQMPAEFARPQSYVFGGDKRLSTDEDFARRSGQKIATRIRTAFQISWDDRLEINGMLAFFQGEAKEAYIQQIKPALVSLEPPPKKFVDQYREQTVLGPRWEIDRLASHLAAYVERHASPYAFIRQVFDEIPAKLEDNIAAAFVDLLQEPKLDEFAATSEGRATLDILYEAMITGDVSDFQRKQAQRILQAKMRRIPEREYVEKTGREMIFPVRNIGVTKYCSATFRAVLRPNGKVFVKYTSVKVFQCDMFKEDVKTLGSYSQAREGFEFDPDDIVFVKLYDQGGGTVPIPALALIDFSNQIQESTLNTATTAFVLGLTLGMGGLGGAGVKGFGGRALLWADRVAWAIPAISMVVNEHRDWVLETFPNAGPGILDALQKANQIAGYYGWGRLGFDGIRFVKSKLTPAWEAWRAAPERNGLSAADQKLVKAMDDQIEGLLNDVRKAEVEAGTEAVQHVNQHPSLIEGKPGQRRAKVDDHHEIVEVPDRNLPTGIGCEFHSNGGPRIPCPEGMGNPDAPEAPSRQPAVPTPQTQPFQLRTNEVLIEGNYSIVIVDTPIGPGARYRRSGRGSIHEEVVPGDPVAGDWVPYYGHARTVSVGDFENLLARERITLDDFMNYSQEAKETTLLLLSGRATDVGDWFIKPRAGRWGNPAEAAMNRQMSPWLQSTFPALPPGQVVNDVRVINDWLRRHGVPVGGEYRLGDILPGEPFTVIVEIP